MKVDSGQNSREVSKYHRSFIIIFVAKKFVFWFILWLGRANSDHRLNDWPIAHRLVGLFYLTF